MRSASRHKVCFPVDGVPAINRAIEAYNTCGVRHHVVVAGVLAGQVVETVGGAFDNVSFVFQSEPRGTAHAARVGFNALDAMQAEGEVLIVAGDRIIEPSVLEQFFDVFYSNNCDFALLASPRRDGSTQGRLVFGKANNLLGIVEAADIRDRLSRGAAFDFTDTDNQPLQLDPATVRDLSLVNNSVYLVRLPALRFALERITTDNAQHEEYLSDLAGILASERHNHTPRFRLEAMRVDRPHGIMGFNDPAELLEVETHIRTRMAQQADRELPLSEWVRPVAEWRASFAALREGTGNSASALRDELTSLYGTDPEVLDERIGAYLALLDSASPFMPGDAPALIVRSPGRVNVMGRHIDHQGGNCNLMTIGFETLMLVRPRDDDTVRLHNVDREHFGDREFSVSQLLMDLPWDDWLSVVNSDALSNMVRTYGGDWAQYVMAAVLRLQKKFVQTRVLGMDIVVSGNIPMAAGLSSSSSLVVGAADATIAVSGLNTFPSQLVDLCGEGEWFVGTRGGSADHAAVKLGQKGKVIKVTFFEFAIQEAVSFPPDHVMVVCDSGISAKKNANARDQFNHRICCYRLGYRLIRKAFPQFAPLLQHLRDVNTRHLGLPLSWIYRILLHLPEQTTRQELRAMLSGEDIEPFFETHAEPADGLYPIRGVVLFGLGEMERARLYADCLKSGRIGDIGALMKVSHDGDRAATTDEQGNETPYHAATSNGDLLGLLEDLESGDPDRVIHAQLQWQPGSYGCSLPAIDRMVDAACRTEGVVGAQLAGAGLGGCMMVLARREAVPALKTAVIRGYYEPAGKPPSILICNPIAGAGVLMRR